LSVASCSFFPESEKDNRDILIMTERLTFTGADADGYRHGTTGYVIREQSQGHYIAQRSALSHPSYDTERPFQRPAGPVSDEEIRFSRKGLELRPLVHPAAAGIRLAV